MDSVRRTARFEAVAGEVMEPLRRYLARRTDRETADDALSDTLLVLWRRLDEAPAQVLPWAYGIARHCLANAERSHRRQLRVAGKMAALDPPRQQSSDTTLADLDLHEALERLTPAERELLRLWAWEQLTPREIAQVLEVTPNAVSIRLLRAKEKLAEEMRKIEAAAGHEESGRGSS